jgi:Asp-tRNA(Asn)/Glu-tRNA(Gln) amidotransferase A subunit family amidase
VPQCPVVSVPVGAHRRDSDAGLPIGMQVVGRRWRDDVVLEIAHAVELNPA